MLLMGLAIWLLGREAPTTEAPAFDVQLVTLAPAAARSPDESRRGIDTLVEPPSRRPPAEAPSATPPSPLPPTTATADPAAGVARALSRRLGCLPSAVAEMTPERRDRCRDALAEAGAASDGPAPTLDLSRRGRIGKDPDFDLSRRPKNGCKLRAAGARDPMGKEGAAAGVSCAWSF